MVPPEPSQQHNVASSAERLGAVSTTTAMNPNLAKEDVAGSGSSGDDGKDGRTTQNESGHEASAAHHNEKGPEEPQLEKRTLDEELVPVDDATTAPNQVLDDSQTVALAATTKAEKDTGAVSDDGDASDGAKPEIQHIIEQFKGSDALPDEESVTSPSASVLPIFQYPPRGSSLEHRAEPEDSKEAEGVTSTIDAKRAHRQSVASQATVVHPPLPEPEPEPALPFDFHRFLEQLRHRTADPVAKFLRSFLQEFGKRQWMVHEQTKIIGDFLEFISRRMAQCEVWRSVSDAEFDNAKEGMEKLVMNRLYTQTFAPEIPPPEPAKGRRKNLTATQVPGRRGQHQEDVERDDVLAQKIRIYSWVNEEHLDVKTFDEKGKRLMGIAQQELNKIKSYRAPRDKVICVLNMCKVLFGFLRTSKSEQSADAFIPLLIYTVLRANPEHLVSNVQYILRFRNPDKLTGEAGYYMSSLMGAVQFIEQLDKTSLTVSDEEFEKNVELAVSAIAERRSREERRSSLPFNEKSTPSRAEVTARHSEGGEQSGPRRRERSGLSNATTVDDDDDENPAVAGLLRTIQKPFSTLGRIFSDDAETGPATTPQPGSSARASPTPQRFAERQVALSGGPAGQTSQAPAVDQARQRMAAEEAAARQASAETAEAQRLARAEHQTVVETLSGMFPSLDKDVISDVVRMKEGRVGLAVDACLALTR